MYKPIISIRKICKSFGGIRALDRLDLSINSNEIVGVMGPNGSGKTVLFDIISGHIKPDSGQILFGEEEIDLVNLPQHKRHRMGITRTYQHLKLFPSLTVLENTMVGLGPQKLYRAFREIFSNEQRKASEKRLADKSLETLKYFQDRLIPYVDRPCFDLSYANRRRLEFSRALASSPKVVLLDEPTAGMNPFETFQLQSMIAKWRQRGITFVIIEHKMFFLEDLVDRVIVLTEGRKIAEGTTEEIRVDSDVINTYLGESHAS